MICRDIESLFEGIDENVTEPFAFIENTYYPTIVEEAIPSELILKKLKSKYFE